MNKKIVRADLAEDLYAAFKNIERKEADRIIDYVINRMKTEITEGNTIELRGFGTFCAKKRNGRKNVKNPKTGAPHKDIPPHYIAAFKPGKELKAAMLALETPKN